MVQVQALPAVAPALPPRDVLLEVIDLKTHFFTDEGVVKAVDGATFSVRRGRTLGLVGESGCGKSMAARSILRIVGRPGRIVGGQLLYHRAAPYTATNTGTNTETNTGTEEERTNQTHAHTHTLDLARLNPRGGEMRAIRGKEISMIFQEPMASLSPVHTVGEPILEALLLHQNVNRQEARRRAIDLLAKVGIPQPQRRIDDYPHQLSGGMRQRAMIAAALACNPTLLIADEPTTALDVTTQAQILDLIAALKDELGMSVMLITHDLGVVAEMADDVAVMYLGKVVERSDVGSLFHDAKHPYTRALLRSIPKLGSRARATARQRLESIRGMVPHPFARPDGCTFHPRCPSFMRGTCDAVAPLPVAIGAGREAACFLYGGHTTTDALPATTALPPLGEPVAPAAIAADVVSLAPDAHVAEGRPSANGHSKHVLLDVTGLAKHFPITKGWLRRKVGVVKAVDGVDLLIREGETLGLVGESGCGKTTAGRTVLRAYEPTGGAVRFRAASGETVDLAKADKRTLRRLRREMQMIFQDPYSSLSPRMTLLRIVGEPLRVNGVARGKALEDRVAGLLERVGLRPEYLRRYPHAFSGGERQRIGIARALALNPRLVVCDEPVSALDVSVRAQTLNLLQDLQEELRLTYLFISHDLSVVEHISDRVAVMYVGRVVEIANTEELFASPKHPYTEALLSAIPKPDPLARGRQRRIILQGDVPDPAHAPSGCAFHPRCRFAQDVCKTETPSLRKVGADGHLAACHFADQLELAGVKPPDT